MPYARKDEIEWLPGNYYHIYNRGAHKVTIFLEEDNYLFTLRKMKKYCKQYDLTLITYSLLPNHYHYCVRQNGENPAGLLPQSVFNSYSKAYNKRYEHSGTLFEGRFKAKPILTDAYLLQLCRYIHANPVKHGLVDHPADWPYSNYLEWIGERPGTLYDPSFVQTHFPQPDEYRKFVLDYIRTRDLPEDLRQYLESLDE